MKKKVYINGMHCEHCSESVKNCLEKLSFVENAEVSLEDKCAVISVSGEASDEEIKTAVYDIGFDVSKIV